MQLNTHTDWHLHTHTHTERSLSPPSISSAYGGCLCMGSCATLYQRPVLRAMHYLTNPIRILRQVAPQPRCCIHTHALKYILQVSFVTKPVHICTPLFFKHSGRSLREHCYTAKLLIETFTI